MSVAVLDISVVGARRLVDSVRGAGFHPTAVDSFEALLDLDASVAVIAFEALWPEPQKALERLRARRPTARLVVVFQDDAPRLKLGERLWSVGLCDQFVSRALSPHELRPLLRQAWADSLLDETPETPAAGGVSLQDRVRSLSTLAAGLAGQTDIKGLARELFVRLPQLIDYSLCELLVIEGDAASLYVSQTKLVEHDHLWELAREVCSVAAPHTEQPLVPEQLAWEGASMALPRASPHSDGPELSIAYPMVVGGQLVGCLGMRMSGTVQETDARTMVQIVASQLGASVRYAHMLAQAMAQAVTDELTGVRNRRYLRTALDHEWRRAHRYGFPLALAIVDLDHFKRVNDDHGHVIGDQVLVKLATIIRKQLRDSDHVVRYGGEEFLLLLPQTGGAEALHVIERLRALVATTTMYEDESARVHITVSAGIATTGAGATTPDHLVELADTAMFESKRSGRNAVTLAGTPTQPTAPPARRQTAEVPPLPRPGVRREPRALVMCDDAATRIQVDRVLHAAQCAVAPEFVPEEIGRCNLFIIGESKLRESLGPVLRQLQRDPAVRIVVINEHGDRRAALDTIQAERVEHLVPSAIADEALFATLTKLIVGDYFGIQKYLMCGAHTETWKLEKPDDKPRVLDGIIRFARSANCHPRIADQLVRAVDEMIINALFRSARGGVSLRPVSVELGSDGRLLAVGVSDEHGMLDNRDIFDGIGAALQSQVHGVPAHTAHAHLGFRIMLDALSQLSVNVDPGRRTEIIGIIDLRRSLREHRAAVPGLGLFRVDTDS